MGGMPGLYVLCVKVGKRGIKNENVYVCVCLYSYIISSPFLCCLFYFQRRTLPVLHKHINTPQKAYIYASIYLRERRWSTIVGRRLAVHGVADLWL